MLFGVKLVNQRLTVRVHLECRMYESEKSSCDIMPWDWIRESELNGSSVCSKCLIRCITQYITQLYLFILFIKVLNLTIDLLLWTLIRRTREWFDVFRIFIVMLFEFKYECSNSSHRVLFLIHEFLESFNLWIRWRFSPSIYSNLIPQFWNPHDFEFKKLSNIQ